MKAFLHTDTHKYILCGNRLRFNGAEAGKHTTELVAERLHGIARKRWLQALAAGYMRLKNGFQVKNLR
ncbi:hypothetical protein DP190_20865 [Enterobacter cloacae]|uniref:hypothetical protein n=1 Tax=Enterobacter sp. 148H3 TaxID=3077756 RepID=UPI000DCC5CAB|nr:hypothetical protein [Enterobacter sp. 148H3]RAY79839.1 hypothetical protein DP190_20865 [Enterobacter cloacae]